MNTSTIAARPPADLPTSQQLNDHISRQGAGCPRCGGDAMTQGDSYDHEGGHITQVMTCDGCELVWVDSYQYSDLMIRKD